MILRGSVYSHVLEMETGITIVLNNKLDVKDYKTVYLLHGLRGSNGNFADYTMLPSYAFSYDAVFVMPETNRSFYQDMKYGQKFFTYISEELPLICQNVFNVSSLAENTSIIGVSLGGYGALKCALSKPEQYGFCASISAPPIIFMEQAIKYNRANQDSAEFINEYGEQFVRDFKGAFGENIEYDTKSELLYLAKKACVKPKIYMTCGSSDPYIRENRLFVKEINKLDFNVKYEESNGGHDWFYFNNALKTCLVNCFGK